VRCIIRSVRPFAMLALLCIALLCIVAPPATMFAAPERPQITGIALVRIRVSNMDASRTFYAKTLGLPQVSQGCFSPASAATCFSVNSVQKLELLPSDPAENKNAVESVGYHVRDASTLRDYLLARGVKCSEVARSASGDKFIEVRDPEDHRIVFLSPGNGTVSSVVISPLSNQIIHTGWVVRDRAAEDAFYKDILGFRLYWHGGMKDDETNWVAMEVPNGAHWLEYMLRISPNADHHTLGVMNHISLGVTDIKATDARLIKNGWKPTEEPKLGRDGKWQLNVYDPDDTRVEYMEFKPSQKPCCSEFTGPHPGPQQ
jgi:catechol 2,3-dioxygenase-like lactoylglutathione lyase family enzyme